MIVFVLLALVLAAAVAGVGVILGALALLVRGLFWFILFPIRLVLSFIALPLVLGVLVLAALSVIGVTILGALFVGLGLVLGALVSAALPLALVFGACWLVARLVRRPAAA